MKVVPKTNKGDTALSNTGTIERDMTSVPDYWDVGRLNALLPSDKTSGLWTKEELDSFTEDELYKKIVRICTPICNILSEFTFSKGIVQTSSSYISQVFNKETKEVALKRIKIDEKTTLEEKALVLVEVEVSRNFFHKNIVGFFNAYSKADRTGLTVWLEMEYMTGGSLQSILGERRYSNEALRMTEDDIATVCVQVLEGLKCLHDKGVFHRDLKPENILLSTEGLVKLCDFGLAANSTGKHNEKLGTRYWMAPEVIQREEYNEKVDIWSLGIIVVEMADGIPPHNDVNATHKTILNKILKSEEPKIKLRIPSTNLADFISQCLNKSPSKRPPVEDLLKHSFLLNSKSPCFLSRLIKANLRKGTLEWLDPPSNYIIQTGVNSEVNIV